MKTLVWSTIEEECKLIQDMNKEEAISFILSSKVSSLAYLKRLLSSENINKVEMLEFIDTVLLETRVIKNKIKIKGETKWIKN